MRLSASTKSVACVAAALVPIMVVVTGCGDFFTQKTSQNRVPDWAADAVYYQIFPERFRNGDPSNDPDRASLEFVDEVPVSWTPTAWTREWYGRDAWEEEMGTDFYENGVFHRRYGGDIQGVIDGLDYLQALGINVIYFNPVFWARSMHKYDGNTFHHVDPHFGPDPAGDFAMMQTETADPETWHWTAADKLFLELVEAAHDKEIRVIIDGVWNHTGRDFFAFADLRSRQQQSAYKDWYIVSSFDDPATEADEFDYKGWWDVRTLPEFADTRDGKDLHPGPKAYVFASTRRWMDPDGDGDSSDGIDGWRLDVANEVPIKFWAEWNTLVRSLKPDAYTVSEIWEDAADFLERGGFSATMNYHAFAFPVKGFLIDRSIGATRFVDLINSRRAEYDVGTAYALQNLIDSHDTDRLASMIVNRRPSDDDGRYRYDHDVSPRHVDTYLVRKPNEDERRIQKLVALFQMTYAGAPMIYYGTAAGMWGADDPDDRMPMVWPHLSYETQHEDPLGRPRSPDTVEFDREMFEYYRSIIGIRNESEALRRGSFVVMHAADETNTLAFERATADDRRLVALNRGEANATVDIRLVDLHESWRSDFKLEIVTDGTAVSASNTGAALRIVIPPLTGAILTAAKSE